MADARHHSAPPGWDSEILSGVILYSSLYHRPCSLTREMRIRRPAGDKYIRLRRKWIFRCRATSTSILATIGNIAAIVGNLIFSALLGTECLAAFIGFGCFFSGKIINVTLSWIHCTILIYMHIKQINENLLAVCFFVCLFFPRPVKEPFKKPVEAGTSSKVWKE